MPNKFTEKDRIEARKRLIREATKALGLDGANKPWEVITIAFRRWNVEDPERCAQWTYNRLLEDGTFSDDLENFCIDVIRDPLGNSILLAEAHSVKK